MSRIGNRKLAIPTGVTLEVVEKDLTVKGPKGELSAVIPNDIEVIVEEQIVSVSRTNELIHSKQLHGTINANIKNMMEGVSTGFSKALEIIGVGYRFNLKGNTLVINAGYSKPKELNVPAGLTVTQNGNNEITVSGIDKVLVGEFAANIRKVRKPEPYKGKGIRYKGEYVRRKEGKKAK